MFCLHSYITLPQVSINCLDHCAPNAAVVVLHAATQLVMLITSQKSTHQLTEFERKCGHQRNPIEVAALLLSGDEVQHIQNMTLKHNTSRHIPKDLSSLNCIAYALLQSITALTVRTKKARVELLF